MLLFEASLQRSFRLTRSEDFQRVRRNGKSFAHPLLVLVIQNSESAHTRVGVAAGKTTGSAVYRNRAKRILREAVRPLVPSLKGGWDLILIARPALVRATLEQTRQALLSLLHRANLIAVNES